MNSINVFCFTISLILLVASIMFIKKKSLDIKYTLLWMIISIFFMIISVNSRVVDYFAACIGIKYAPAFLFLMGILFSFVMIFYLLILISEMQRKLTKLIQENAILKDKVEETLK